jgi:N-carbamoyl-L-amino-acid hydrolase
VLTLPSGRIARIDGARLLAGLDELARYGADDRGGVSRLGYGDADNAARRYLMSRASDLGLRSSVDQAGNLFFRRERAASDRQVLLIGSHLDSVAYGGRYDGAYGVVAAMEVLATLSRSVGGSGYEPVAVAFANEEGGLFPAPFLGSKAMIGQAVDPDMITDPAGRSLRGPLRAAGGDPDRLDRAAWQPEQLGAFLELHIEQGPRLERAGVPIGVVDTITGRSIFEITIRGRQNHAGTTPMDARKDALVTAARLVLAIEDLAVRRGLCTVATVGQINADPNMTNVVPGEVSLTAEIRDGSPTRLDAAERALTGLAARIGSGLSAHVRRTMRVAPVPTDARLRSCSEAAARHLGLATLTVPSGAGHDAQIIGAVAPVGLIFVPSRDGISHAPQEDTAPEDLLAGAEVLMGTVLHLMASDEALRW